MANPVKAQFLERLESRYGNIRKLGDSQSLFEIGQGAARIYIRYSKIHSRNQAFYGLRKKDLQCLEGHPSIICFLWDTQKEPLLVPFENYEEVFETACTAHGGQY